MAYDSSTFSIVLDITERNEMCLYEVPKFISFFGVAYYKTNIIIFI